MTTHSLRLDSSPGGAIDVYLGNQEKRNFSTYGFTFRVLIHTPQESACVYFSSGVPEKGPTCILQPSNLLSEKKPLLAVSLASNSKGGVSLTAELPEESIVIVEETLDCRKSWLRDRDFVQWRRRALLEALDAETLRLVRTVNVRLEGLGFAVEGPAGGTFILSQEETCRANFELSLEDLSYLCAREDLSAEDVVELFLKQEQE